MVGRMTHSAALNLPQLRLLHELTPVRSLAVRLLHGWRRQEQGRDQRGLVLLKYKKEHRPLPTILISS